MSRDLLEDWREELGLDAIGVCRSGPAPHFLAYQAWVEREFHGTMDFMARQKDLRRDPETLLPGVKSIIAVALNYNQPNPIVEGQPRIARYALGRDYHRVLRSKLKRLGNLLLRDFPEAEVRPCVDSAPIFERDYAHLAGLGWFGKNTMLIDSHRGSWFFIGLLLTTLEIEPDRPSLGGCGTCQKCIEACPTGAIVFEDGRWQIDARRCISYLTIEHRGPATLTTGGWTFGCDVCQEVCPFNQPRQSQPLRAAVTQEPDFLQRRSWPSLADMAEMTRPQWDVLTQGSAVRRAGYDGLRRNAKNFLPKPSSEREDEDSLERPIS